MTEQGDATGVEVAKTTARSLGEANLKTMQLQQQTASTYWESILESIGDGFWVFDRSWCCTYINNRQAQLVGIEKEDVLGKNVWELFPDLVGTDLYHQLHHAVAAQTPAHFEHFSSTWQGWFELRVYPSANGVSILTVDITERKQTEDALQDRQRLVQQLAEMSPGLLYLYDVVEQRNIYINARSLELLGYPPETVLTMGTDFMPQVMHPDDLAQMPAHLERLNTSHNGSFFELEYRMRHVNGEWRWFSSRDTVFSRTAQGQVRQILGTAQDITERKRTQEALRESEERFQAFMNHSPASAWIADEQGRLLYLSPTYFRMFQFPVQDAVGKNIFEIYPAEFAQQFIENNKRVFETKQVIETIETAPRPDGSVGEFLVYKFPIPSGEETLLGGVAVDITDRRQAEEALRESEQQLKIALQTAKLGSWQHDLVTGTLSCSDQCKANFGLPPDAEFSHQTLFAALHPDDRESVQVAIRRAIEERTNYEVEERCFWPDGSLHWLIARGRLVYDLDGTPVRMVGVTLDITERKQFEESLKAANQKISNILESITDAFVAFDREWHYTYVNPEAARLLQRSPEELLGRRWQEVFPQAEYLNPQLYQQMYRAADAQVTVKMESFSFVANCWMEISIFPFSEGLAVYFRDISAQKRDEQRKAAKFAVARVLAEATTLVDAAPAILQALCESLRWQLGVIWSVDRHNHVLRYVNSWQAPTVNVQDFIEASQQTTFALGVGLPGRIWESHHPIWIRLLQDDTNFPLTAQAAKGGLQAAFGFPIQLGDEILGVIECFSDTVEEPDEDLLQRLAVIGSHIAQFMERKRTEDALRESQELFECFMKHSPARAFIKDEAGRYIYVNSLIEQDFNRKLADWVGKTDFDLFSSEIAQQWRENDLTVLSTNQPLKFLESVPAKDGNQFAMSFKFPFQDASGRRFVAGMSVDITQQIRIQEALETNLAQLEAVLHSMTDGLIIVDPKGTILTFNPAALALHGFESMEDVHQHLQDNAHLFEVCELDGQPLSFTHWPISRAIAGETFSGRRIHVRRTDTGKYWVGQYGGTPVRNKAGEIILALVTISDITAQFMAEEALREREQRFSTLFNGMDDWVLVYPIMPDRQPGPFIEVNEQACKKLGYSREELLTMSVADILEPALINPKASIETLLASSHVVVESIHTTKKGERIAVEVNATLFILNGLPTVQAICRDITKRKQTEEALRKSERLYRAIGETIDYGIWVCEPDGRNIYASESFLRLVGLTQEQCSEFGWKDVLHPDDAPATIAAWKECTRSGEFWDIEHRFRGVDGNWHPILARGVPVRDENGEIICWAGINLDISRLKRVELQWRESEERFRLATRAVDSLVYDWDVATGIVYRSEGLYRLIGVRPEEAPATRQWWIERIHPDDLTRLQAVGGSILTGNNDRFDAEYRVRHEDGRWIDVWDCSYLIRDGNGQIIRIVGSTTDITHRKRAEAEREQLLARERAAREEAEVANRIKDEFLAVLSHELRSPLNPILGWAKLLRSRKFDEKATDRALETIERNAKLQTQLIEDLLDVSRILRGKMVVNTGPVNLATTIEAALETVRLAAQAKDIEIQTLLDTNIGNISGDPNRLQQVVWNLLSNAVKFTPAKGWVEVRLERVGRQAQIQVRDNGKGISPEFLPHVFDYFRQADGSTTRKFGGLGLGLAIVRHLVELHGGSVWAESPGEELGTTFTVRLPLMETAPKAPQQVLSPNWADLNGLHVLVVDDQADIRDLIAYIFKQAGAKVTVATSAAEAFAALNSSVPDVLVCDIGMPDIDGYMLMRQIRAMPAERGGKLLAIALTAYAGESDQQQALDAGFQLHISKPVEPEALVRAIANLLATDNQI